MGYLPPNLCRLDGLCLVFFCHCIHYSLWCKCCDYVIIVSLDKKVMIPVRQRFLVLLTPSRFCLFSVLAQFCAQIQDNKVHRPPLPTIISLPRYEHACIRSSRVGVQHPQSLRRISAKSCFVKLYDAFRAFLSSTSAAVFERDDARRLKMTETPLQQSNSRPHRLKDTRLLYL